MMARAEDYISEVLEAFDFGAPVVGAVRYGQGHINDTFVVHTQPEHICCRRFILQRISAAAFHHPDQLMANITGVTEYLGREIEKNGGNREREAMRVIRTRTGGTFYTDRDGSAWRLYPFVEGTVCYQMAETPELFAASGRAFGRFQRLLRDYPAHTLYETIPRFHDTEDRLEMLEKRRFDLLRRFLTERLEPATAVICYNDEIAYHLIQALLEAGRRVPEEVAVVSFDNSYLSQLGPVPITSLSHRSRMGRVAAEQMIGLLQGEAARSKSLEWELVTRSSG